MPRPNSIEVVENISVLKQVIHKTLEPLLKQHNLSAQQWHMLRMMAKRGQGITTTELAESAQITSGAVSQFINQLAEMGYIVRTEDPTDRRITVLSLTPKSVDLLKTLKTAMQKVLNESFSCLNNQELQELMHLLKKVGSHTKTMEDEKHDKRSN